MVVVVRALVFLAPQVLSARQIPVAYSYRNAFDVVFFCCARLFVPSLPRVLFYPYRRYFDRLFFVISFMLALVCFSCKVLVSVRLRCAMCVDVI